jgi:glucokinase
MASHKIQRAIVFEINRKGGTASLFLPNKPYNHLSLNAQDFCVLTLDAGGTHFAFGAVKAGEILIAAKVYKAEKYALDKSLEQIIQGFEAVIAEIQSSYHAISFSFPGPSRYEEGRVGPLHNLPCYDREIGLGPMLEEHFGVPVFINNDGNLFTLGEASYGRLKEYQDALCELGTSKKIKGLLGITLGTGLGAGFVYQGQMMKGENGSALEIWTNPSLELEDRPLESRFNADYFSNRFSILSSLQGVYTPKEIYHFALDSGSPFHTPAKQVFFELGDSLGKVLSSLINIFDVSLVIGGGLSGASDLFLPRAVHYCNANFPSECGEGRPRTLNKVYLWPQKPDHKYVEGEKFVWVSTPKHATSDAVFFGAYTYALQQFSFLSP